MLWCIGGDFNVTHFPSERLGEAHFSLNMEFSDYIYELGLMDLPLVGGSFTWSNNRNSLCQELIGFVSSDWEAKFPDLFQKWLLRLCSDHFPILLDCGGSLGGKKLSSLIICGLRQKVLWTE